MLQYTANNLDDLSSVFADIRQRTAQAAREELSKLAATQPGWEDPAIYVDGRPGKPEAVKDFGTIVIVPSGGPVEEAMQLAWEFVNAQTMRAWSAFNRSTGFYASSVSWFMNGQHVGQELPRVERMGLKGNVQLVGRAGYASALEIDLPNHIIYGAYTLLKSTFGNRLALAYGYRLAHEYSQVWPADRKSPRPMAVPVLTIGHPTATFRQRATRPGVLRRARLRETKRSATAIVRHAAARLDGGSS